jgi:glycosyltransferase involved in cell wall biosynthesis
MKLAICIPTYKRAALLAALLDDIAMQSLQPDTIVVVDGDPSSGAVRSHLRQRTRISDFLFVPSNHANLAYQRFLGAKVASGHDLLVYLDDDLRISQPDAIEKLIAPLKKENALYAAGTAVIQFPAVQRADDADAVANRIMDSLTGPGLLTRLLGAARHAEPGGITPLGHRIPPRSCEPYVEVQWLRGGVMAFRTEILTDDFFSTDLFALTHVKCGLGEDTYLGRRALVHGKLYMANNAVFHHPNADPPKAYPIDAFRMGFASAYSRRFVNDTFRGISPPTIADRAALLKGLVGAGAVSVWKAMSTRSKTRFAYSAGFLTGSAKALLRAPKAHMLTPNISWWKDATAACESTELIAPEEGSNGH